MSDQILLGGQIIQADLDMCHPSPTNPRKTFDETALRELADSIKSTGLAQPITVREMPQHVADQLGTAARLEIVCGERRWRAHKLAGLPTIECILRDLTDEQAIRIQVLENLQREDLSAIEEAEGFAMLRRQGMSADQIGDEIGKSREYVYGQLKLLDLIEPCRDAVRSKRIIASIAGLIARIPVPEMQLDALELVTQRDEYSGEPMSFRAAKALISQRYTRNLAKAPFDAADPTLTEAGACQDCPHHLANQRGGEASANVCTNPPCYDIKRQAHNVRLLALPDDTPRIDIPKAEGSTGPTNWTDYDAAGYRMLSSTYHNDPQRRSYADWLQANGESVPIAVHVCSVTGDARAVACIDDLIKADNRIKQREAATAEQARIDVIDEETEHSDGEGGVLSFEGTHTNEPSMPKAAAPVAAAAHAKAKAEQHDPLKIAYAQYRAELEIEILRNQPLLIGGPLLGLVANALEGGVPQDFASDGGAMAVILGHVIKNAKKWGRSGNPVGLEVIAETVGVDPTPLLDKHVPAPEGCARPNEHGVYPKQHTLHHGAAKTEIYIHITQTAEGWRGTTELKHATGGRSGPITKHDEAYATDKEAISAIATGFADSIEAGREDIPGKAQKPLVFWLRRLAQDLTPNAGTNPQKEAA